MAVTEQQTIFDYTAGAGATSFAYQCRVLDGADLVVVVEGEEKTFNVDYSVTGVLSDSGGSVVFGEAMTGGETVKIRRVTRLIRGTDYQTAGDFRAAVVNPDIDRAILALQDLIAGAVEIRNSIRVPAGESIEALPSAAARALTSPVFGPTGELTVAPALPAGTQFQYGNTTIDEFPPGLYTVFPISANPGLRRNIRFHAGPVEQFAPKDWDWSASDPLNVYPTDPFPTDVGFRIESTIPMPQGVSDAGTALFDPRVNYAVATIGSRLVMGEVSPSDFPWRAKFDNNPASASFNVAAINACFAWAERYGYGIKLPRGAAFVDGTLYYGSQSIVGQSSSPSFLKGHGSWQTTIRAKPGFTGTVLQAWSLAGIEMGHFFIEGGGTAHVLLDCEWKPSVGPSCQCNFHDIRGGGASPASYGPLMNFRNQNDTTLYKIACNAANNTTCAIDATGPGGLMWLDSCIWNGGFLRFGCQNGGILNSWGHGLELAESCTNYGTGTNLYLYPNTTYNSNVWSQSSASFQSTRALKFFSSQFIGFPKTPIASGSAVGATATVNATEAHGLQTGQSVVVEGCTPAAYNGTYTVTVPSGSATQIVFVAGSAPGGPLTVMGTMYPATASYLNVNAYSVIDFDSCQFVGTVSKLFGSASRRDSYANVLVRIRGGSIGSSAQINEPGGFEVECEGFVDDTTGFNVNKNRGGTFTSTVIGSTAAGAATYSARDGSYTRIGNRVYWQLRVAWAGHTGTGDLRITGFPLTQSGQEGVDVDYSNNPFAGAAVTGLMSGNFIQFFNLVGANKAMSATGDLILSGSYLVLA